MSMSDPLADMLTRIRNAVMVRHETIEMPLSRGKLNVAKILKKEGYIADYKVVEDNRQGLLQIVLKNDRKDRRVITGLKRVSKPGCRIYVKHDEIPRVMSGLGTAIISTSKGVLTDKEAREMKVGGELLCEIW